MPTRLLSLFQPFREPINYIAGECYGKPIRYLKVVPVSHPYVLVIPHRSLIMSNPVILITGALTGIGRATALAFAKIGARVVANGRRPTEGKGLQVELQRLGAEAVFIEADVRHDDEVAGLIDQAVARFGHLDVAGNLAAAHGHAGVVRTPATQSLAAPS